MTPEVEQAIEQVREAFGDATVTAVADPHGGAFVTVEPVDPGSQYNFRETWVKFHVTFQYPMADVYPHFVRPDLRHLDPPTGMTPNTPLGEATSMGASSDDGSSAIQISRRSNRLNPGTDTAALKLVKVLDWLRSR